MKTGLLNNTVIICYIILKKSFLSIFIRFIYYVRSPSVLRIVHYCFGNSLKTFYVNFFANFLHYFGCQPSHFYPLECSLRRTAHGPRQRSREPTVLVRGPPSTTSASTLHRAQPVLQRACRPGRSRGPGPA